MNVLLKGDKYSLRDFLRDDSIRQGIVSMPTSFGNGLVNLFIIKIDEKNGTATSLFYKQLFRDGDEATIYQGDALEFLLSIDYENKIIIHLDSIMSVSLEKEFDFLNQEYEVWNARDISEKAKKDYRDSMLEKVEKELSLEENDRFNSIYNSYIEENKEKVISDYLKKPDLQYVLYVSRLGSHSNDELFNPLNLAELQSYLIDPLLIDSLVETNYKADIDMDDAIKVKAKNAILEDLKKHPTPYIKLSLEIREAIKEGGKTLNITTKDGKTVKVINKLEQGKEFRTVVGWNYVEIEDIEKITFNRKVLFLAK